MFHMATKKTRHRAGSFEFFDLHRAVDLARTTVMMMTMMTGHRVCRDNRTCENNEGNNGEQYSANLHRSSPYFWYPDGSGLPALDAAYYGYPS
jgi:hypothetical protein